MDLINSQVYGGQNSGYNYILNVIDKFSKFLWSYPLKDKKAKTVKDLLEDLFFCYGFSVLLHSDLAKNLSMKKLKSCVQNLKSNKSMVELVIRNHRDK